jgi:hypothetical protein
MKTRTKFLCAGLAVLLALGLAGCATTDHASDPGGSAPEPQNPATAPASYPANWQ